MSESHGIKFKIHCDVTSHVLVDRYQKFWKVLTTKLHNIWPQKKSSSSTMSFKRRLIESALVLTSMCTFLFFLISFWCASNSDSCCLLPECFSTRCSISVSRAAIVLCSSSWSASGLSPLKWIIHLTKLMSLHLYSYSFTVLPHLKQKCIILCVSHQISSLPYLGMSSGPFLYKLLNLCCLFCPRFYFPKNKMQPVHNVQVPYSITFCYLLVHLTPK